MATTIPSVRAVGNVISGSGDVGPNIPVGTTTNDIMLLFCETNGQTVAAPSGGWALIDTQTTTGTRLTVFWKRATASESAPTVVDPGDHVIARIMSISGCVEVGDPWDTYLGGVEATDDSSLSATGVTTSVANTLIVVACSTGFDNGVNDTTGFSSWVNANLSSVTEQIDNRRSAGDGGTLGVATGGKATAGATGATTATLAPADPKAFLTIALKSRDLDIDKIYDRFDSWASTTGHFGGGVVGTWTLSNGRLEGTCASSAATLTSYTTYVASGLAPSIRVDQAPTGGNGTMFAYMRVQESSSYYMEVGVSGANFYAKRNQNNTPTTTNIATYDPDVHRYWRVRNIDSSNWAIDYSPNGYTWIQGATFTSDQFTTSLRLIFATGYTGSETSPPNFIIDNLNIVISSPGNSVGVLGGAGGG